jgi:hypothetical protein
MKRVPLQQRGRLKRSPCRPRPRRARPDKDDAEYIAWLKEQRCCAPAARHPGPSDPHHRPGEGMGLRSHDHEAIPLCRLHHKQVDVFAGPFAGWSREERQAWHTKQVKLHRARFALAQAEARA